MFTSQPRIKLSTRNSVFSIRRRMIKKKRFFWILIRRLKSFIFMRQVILQEKVIVFHNGFSTELPTGYHPFFTAFSTTWAPIVR